MVIENFTKLIKKYDEEFSVDKYLKFNEKLKQSLCSELKDIDINILYKYSLVIPLENNYLIAIYKDNTKSIYKI